MALPEEVHEGNIYTCQFRKNDFTHENRDHPVVVLVAEYSRNTRNFRALIAMAEVRQTSKGINIQVNLDELYSVPIEKLNVSTPILKPEELEGWKAQLRERIG
jgi:hypothetical protein